MFTSLCCLLYAKKIPNAQFQHVQMKTLMILHVRCAYKAEYSSRFRVFSFSLFCLWKSKHQNVSANVYITRKKEISTSRLSLHICHFCETHKYLSQRSAKSCKQQRIFRSMKIHFFILLSNEQPFLSLVFFLIHRVKKRNHQRHRSWIKLNLRFSQFILYVDFWCSFSSTACICFSSWTKKNPEKSREEEKELKQCKIAHIIWICLVLFSVRLNEIMLFFHVWYVSLFCGAWKNRKEISRRENLAMTRCYIKNTATRKKNEHVSPQPLPSIPLKDFNITFASALQYLCCLLFSLLASFPYSSTHCSFTCVRVSNVPFSIAGWCHYNFFENDMKNCI